MSIIMAAMSWRWVNNVGNKLQNVRKGFNDMKFEVPEKYKGTILEKWAIYWKHLLRDYKEVVVETVKDSKAKPKKATAIMTGLGFLAYCGRNNPDEISYREKILECANDVLLLADRARKPSAAAHLAYIERCYNAGLMRRLSLGVVSFMWIDNYDPDCAIYESQCSYLEPRYLTFYQRVVDVGFLSHWWHVENVMEDYDYNPDEFEEENS